MRTLFFVVNQDLADGSAHALYCLRHCWWLAATNDQVLVRLVYPGNTSNRNVLDPLGLKPLPNLRLHALPCIRKLRGRRGITVNALYYWAVVFFLRSKKRPGDILASASFPKFFHFLCRRKRLLHGLRTVYEVHQLACMEHGPQAKASQMEREVLACSEIILSTTKVLHEQLELLFPDKITDVLGLACGFDPEAVPGPDTSTGRPFTLAYIGSLYEEQGVRWLVQSWPGIKKMIGFPLKLVIIGGPDGEVEHLRNLAGREDQTLCLRGFVPPGKLAGHLQSVDALVIPALPVGRMPYVAITKAYDYLGLNRPIVAADLPSIREILRPGLEAMLFSPGDHAGLAESIRAIHADASLVVALLANCRERCRVYSWEARAKRCWEVIGA